MSSGKHDLAVTANVIVFRDDPPEFFSLDCSSTAFFTSFSEPTPTPSEEPQQIGQELILGVAVTVAVIGVGLGLLVYLMKRK